MKKLEHLFSTLLNESEIIQMMDKLKEKALAGDIRAILFLLQNVGHKKLEHVEKSTKKNKKSVIIIPPPEDVFLKERKGLVMTLIRMGPRTLEQISSWPEMNAKDAREMLNHPWFSEDSGKWSPSNLAYQMIQESNGVVEP